MTENSDKAFTRKEVRHSECACCEYAANRIHELRQVILGSVNAAKSGRPQGEQWVEAVEKMLYRHDPKTCDES